MGNITSSEDEDDDVSIIDEDDRKLDALAVRAAEASRPLRRAPATKASRAKRKSNGTKRKAEESGSISRPAKKKRKLHTWDERYEQLKAFKKEYGHINVPKSRELKALQEWLYRCKKRKNGPCYNQLQLTGKQIEKLDELDVSWSLPKATPIRSWDDSFAELESFCKKNGHCNVPRKTETRLHHWLVSQKQYARGTRQPELTKEQIKKLKSVGVTW